MTCKTAKLRALWLAIMLGLLTSGPMAMAQEETEEEEAVVEFPAALDAKLEGLSAEQLAYLKDSSKTRRYAL